MLGSNAIQTLQNASIIVFGVGGVGGYCAEALVRSGIGSITIVDYDRLDITNLNRQVIALHSTIGEVKVDVLKSRLLDINPSLRITTLEKRIYPENLLDFNLQDYDYVVDCIDTITSKISIAEYCYHNNIHLISSMGFGNKINPLDIKVSDINKTSACPLAKVMRRELRNRKIKKLKSVWSSEIPSKRIVEENHGKRSPGSVSFVPSAAGIVIASEVIKDIIGKDDYEKTRTCN